MAEVDVALVLGQFAIIGLFLGQVDQRRVGHAVILVSHNLKLVGTNHLADVVSDDFGVAHLDIAYRIVVSRLREKHYQCFACCFHFFFLFLFCLAAACSRYEQCHSDCNDILEFHSRCLLS